MFEHLKIWTLCVWTFELCMFEHLNIRSGKLASVSTWWCTWAGSYFEGASKFLHFPRGGDKMLMIMMIMMIMIYILWWSVCMSVTKNHHFLYRSANNHGFGWFPWFFKVVSWFFMVFGWFLWFFKEVSWFYMVFGWFPWFFKVVSWFFSRIYPPQTVSWPDDPV